MFLPPAVNRTLTVWRAPLSPQGWRFWAQVSGSGVLHAFAGASPQSSTPACTNPSPHAANLQATQLSVVIALPSSQSSPASGTLLPQPAIGSPKSVVARLWPVTLDVVTGQLWVGAVTT